MIEMGGERGSGRSVLAAQHNVDDDEAILGKNTDPNLRAHRYCTLIWGDA